MLGAMNKLVGVDVGGTFTDLVLVDEATARAKVTGGNAHGWTALTCGAADDVDAVLRRRGVRAASYSFRRYASNASRSSVPMNPRSMTSPSEETIGGRLGGGFRRAARLNWAS